MFKREVGAISFLATLLLLFMSACGQETASIRDTTPPTVISTTPAQGATGVALNTTISATSARQ